MINVKRTSSATRSSLSDTRFEFGRIINVYPDRGTVDWRSEMTEQYRNDIPYVLPYFDQTLGTGICFNPEPGTTAICATTSDGLPMIFAFIGAPEDGSYQCGRPQSNPGDISITGRDGNFLQVRRGGILQIGSTSLCQTVYIPIRNIIQNYSENFEIYTLAGQLKLNVARVEDSSEGHSRCQYSLDVKEYSDDKSEIVSIDAGSLDNNNLFTLTTKDSGNNGKTQVSLSINKQGNLDLSIKNDLTIKTNNNINLSSKQNTNINADNEMKISASTKLDIDSKEITMKGDSKVDVISDTTVLIDAPQIKLTSSAIAPVMRYTPDISAFFAAVGAALTAIGAPVPIPTLCFNNQISA